MNEIQDAELRELKFKGIKRLDKDMEKEKMDVRLIKST